jgi:5-formyltetrahydrofolate cyclo-ligase
MSSVQAAKSILRKEMKSRLLAMTKEQILLESEQLTKKVNHQLIILLSINVIELIDTFQFVENPIYQESQRVAVYLSMSEEVQTHGILQNIFEAGKHCFIPR